MHELELNEPEPLEENVTEPVGVDFVPPDVSETVAVQVVDWASATDEGEHDTAVDVARFATVTVSEPELT